MGRGSLSLSFACVMEKRRASNLADLDKAIDVAADECVIAGSIWRALPLYSESVASPSSFVQPDTGRSNHVCSGARISRRTILQA